MAKWTAKYAFFLEKQVTMPQIIVTESLERSVTNRLRVLLSVALGPTHNIVILGRPWGHTQYSHPG